jgi:hypothetical protein
MPVAVAEALREQDEGLMLVGETPGPLMVQELAIAEPVIVKLAVPPEFTRVGLAVIDTDAPPLHGGGAGGTGTGAGGTGTGAGGTGTGAGGTGTGAGGTGAGGTGTGAGGTGAGTAHTIVPAIGYVLQSPAVAAQVLLVQVLAAQEVSGVQEGGGSAHTLVPATCPEHPSEHVVVLHVVAAHELSGVQNPLQE